MRMMTKRQQEEEARERGFNPSLSSFSQHRHTYSQTHTHKHTQPSPPRGPTIPRSPHPFLLSFPLSLSSLHIKVRWSQRGIFSRASQTLHFALSCSFPLPQHTNTHTHTHTALHHYTHTHTNTQTDTQTATHHYTHTNIHTYARIVKTRTHKHTDTTTHTQTTSHTYTHVHTNTSHPPRVRQP